MADDKTAGELIEELGTADRETAQAALQTELERDPQRVTVVRAAEERLAVLAVPGEVLEATPEGAWAQLLDGDGNPVLVDGQPVEAELSV